MKPVYAVVPASPADAKALYAFEKRCFANPVDVFSVARLTYLLCSPTVRVFVIRSPQGDRLIGAVIGLLRHFRVPTDRVLVATRSAIPGTDAPVPSCQKDQLRSWGKGALPCHHGRRRYQRAVWRIASKPSGRIYKIGVDPGYQGKGYASTLLAAMEASFRNTGMRTSCAEVRVSNKASQALFTKHGYTVTNVLPRYYADGEDGVKFWKQLSPAQKTRR